MKYSEPVPIWSLFTALYGFVIAANFTFFIYLIKAPHVQPILFDKSAFGLVTIFFLCMGLIIIDWIWVSIYLADYPKGYNLYRLFHKLSPANKFFLLLFNSLFIISIGISLSLLPYWEKFEVLYLSWDNPLLWFLISLISTHLWDFSSYISKLIIPRVSLYWICYFLLMGIITVTYILWFINRPISIAIFISKNQYVIFSFSIIIVVSLRTWGLIQKNIGDY